ncbi:hypothetical protein R5R35_003202 [Gryllus longicercus]|uniref:PB1 domain-containing protein n=1 Tax=Gryllus longicercus TaxID=2509291 RepID=A0AAN9Z6G4_9ORTH
MNSFTKGVEEQSYPQLDLSGKLIIKAQLGDDVRRIPIHNEAITYDELVLMMQRVFRGKLSSSDDITIKYKDEDGDLITIFDSSDLAFAVQYSRILKLQILVGGEAPTHNWNAPPAHVGIIRRELQHIRDKVNHLLDSLEPRAVEVTSSTAENHSGPTERGNATSNLSSREFDPLQEQLASNKGSGEGDTSATSREEHPPEGSGVDTARGSTPDSIGSSGSRKVSSGYDQTQSQSSHPQPQPQSQQQLSQLPQQQQMTQVTPQQPPASVYQQYQQEQGGQSQSQQQPTPTQQQPPQQAYQPAGYPRYPVVAPYSGSQVVPQQPQMMVQPGQQAVPQNAFQNPYQAYAGVQQPFGPQAGGTPGFRPGAPSQPPQPPHSYASQEYAGPPSAYSSRFSAQPPVPQQQPQQQPPLQQQPQPGGGNPYSKGAYGRPPSQPTYQ